MARSILFFVLFSIFFNPVFAEKICRKHNVITDGFIEMGENFGNKLQVVSTSFNTKDDERNPQPFKYGAAMYFISDRVGSHARNNNDERYEEAWYSEISYTEDSLIFNPVLSGPGNIGSLVKGHEGPFGISQDGSVCYLIRYTRGRTKKSYDIFKSSYDTKKDKWCKPSHLGIIINSDMYELTPGINSDKTRLYFSSNRRGPNSRGVHYFGENYDIWYSDYYPQTRTWGEAVNITDINSDDEDSCPNISFDGKTIVFASKGLEPNYGGSDIYISRFDDSTGKWCKPINLGPKINSGSDENFPSLLYNGDIIMFTSNDDDRDGAKGKTDIYYAFLPRDCELCGDKNFSEVTPVSFTKSTKIQVEVPDACFGELNIIDESGEVVNRIHAGEFKKGMNEFEWKGNTTKKKYLRNGIYKSVLTVEINNEFYTEERIAIISGRRR